MLSVLRISLKFTNYYIHEFKLHKVLYFFNRVASNLLIKAGEDIKAKTLAFQAVDAFEKSGDKEALELMLKEENISEEVKQKILSVLK